MYYLKLGGNKIKALTLVGLCSTQTITFNHFWEVKIWGGC